MSATVRIGIDATTANPPRAGVGSYTYRLVNALDRVIGDGTLVLYFKQRRPNPSLLDEWSRFSVRRNPIPPRIQLRLDRHGLAPAVERFTGRVEVFHSPSFFLPPTRAAGVLTVHDLSWKRFPEHKSKKNVEYYNRMLPRSLSSAEVVVADSESTRRDILHFYDIPEQKVVTVYPGVDDQYRPVQDPEALQTVRQRHGLPDQYLLYVGTLEPRKNVSGLLEAYYRLLERGVTMPLVLVGMKGWLYDDIFEAVERLHLRDRLVITGYVPDEDLPAIYSGAELFVYPSLYEGFGFPIVEAMACGTPVVTTRGSSMDEVAGGAAILVDDPTDPVSLADAVESGLSDATMRYRCVVSGLDRAIQFSWEETAAKMAEIYTRLGG